MSAHLSNEDRVDFMRHKMSRGTLTRGHRQDHYRRCAECGVRLPWDGWEEAMQLHLRDLAEDYAHRAVDAALTEAADRLVRLGNEISRYDDDPVTVMAWRTYADAADLVRIRIPN